jgi:hypothetical protein
MPVLRPDVRIDHDIAKPRKVGQDKILETCFARVLTRYRRVTAEDTDGTLPLKELVDEKTLYPLYRVPENQNPVIRGVQRLDRPDTVVLPEEVEPTLGIADPARRSLDDALLDGRAAVLADTTISEPLSTQGKLKMSAKRTRTRGYDSIVKAFPAHTQAVPCNHCFAGPKP